MLPVHTGITVWLSHSREHQNQLESLLKWMLLHPTPRVFIQ